MISSFRQQACLDIDEALKHCTTKEDYDRIKLIASKLASDQGWSFKKEYDLKNESIYSIWYTFISFYLHINTVCFHWSSLPGLSCWSSTFRHMHVIMFTPDLNVRVILLDQLQYIGARCMSNANCKEMLFQFITSCLIHSLGDQNHQVCSCAVFVC